MWIRINDTNGTRGVAMIVMQQRFKVVTDIFITSSSKVIGVAVSYASQTLYYSS
jgi:hypothetical protein